jgi:hypothetical protein
MSKGSKVCGTVLFLLLKTITIRQMANKNYQKSYDLMSSISYKGGLKG